MELCGNNGESDVPLQEILDGEGMKSRIEQ